MFFSVNSRITVNLIYTIHKFDIYKWRLRNKANRMLQPSNRPQPK